MPDPDDEQKQSQEIQQGLQALQDDYTRTNGSPFLHFFCPILHKDEKTKLCLGHVVGQSIPNCCRATVVQRADVDNFFGSVLEADFTILLQALSTTIQDIVFTPELSKKMRPRVMAGGEEIGHHPFQGHKIPPQHTGFILQSWQGDELKLVLRKPRDQVLDDLKKGCTIAVERDCRIASVGSLIKAAFLTQFRLLGYRYAFSAGGIHVGHDILGGFYRANCGKPVADAKAAAKDYFRKHINMVRPINEFGGKAPLGTVEDNVAMACAGSSGKHFAILVFVRTGSLMHGVLMPSFEGAESVPTYLDFLNNDNETLLVNYCRFDAEDRCWYREDNPIPVTWPKHDKSFQFD